MKKQNTTAKVIAEIAKTMANKACGAVSAWGLCQPKEPKKLTK